MNYGYYANNIFKFVSNEKATIEKDGFNGFKVDIQFCKSRTAPAGQITSMIYDQNLGFDKARTLYYELDKAGLIGGSRNNAKYVKGFDTVKFDKLDFHNEFFSREEIRHAVLDSALPLFQGHMFRMADAELATQEYGVDMCVVDNILTVEGEDMNAA